MKSGNIKCVLKLPNVVHKKTKIHRKIYKRLKLLYIFLGCRARFLYIQSKPTDF